MKMYLPFLMLLSTLALAQGSPEHTPKPLSTLVKPADHLTLEAALELAKRSTAKAAQLDKQVSIAVLDASGTVILLMRGDGVGTHNTEAARRKAYTAVSTKTNTLTLLRNARANPDTQNLNTLPELLLLSGGVPIWYRGNIIGSLGVAGGGSPENDDAIARAAAIPEKGISTTK